MQDVKQLSGFGRAKACFKSCWRMFMANKKLLFFPLLSLVVVLSMFGVAYTAYFGQMFDRTPEDVSGSEICMVMLLLYLAVRVVIAFIRTVKIIYIDGIINNDSARLSECCRRSLSKIWPVFLWSMIESLVGWFFRWLSKRGVLGRIVSLLFGVAWHVIDFFALPVIALREGSFISNIKETAKRVQRDLRIRRGSLSIFSIIFVVPFAIVGLALAYSLHFIATDYHMLGPEFSRVLLIVSLVLMMVLYVVRDVLETTMQVVIYEFYTTGVCSKYFDPMVLREIFRSWGSRSGAKPPPPSLCEKR